MLGSRRLLVIGGIVVGFVVLAILITFMTGGKERKSANVCETFIANISKQDIRGAYNLLSDSARANASYEQWRSTIIGLQNVYQQSTVTLASQKEEVQRGEEPGKEVKRQSLNFTVKNAAATTHATCYVLTSSKGQVVDGFSSTTE